MTDSILDDDERFSDYTKQEQDAIHQALLKAHLKPEAEWPRILFDITTLLCDLHPNPVVRAGEIRDHLKALLAHLEAAAQVYDQMSDLEQAHVEDQRTRLSTELAMLDSLTMAPFDPVAVEHELRSYLNEWPSLAQAHPAQARQILRKLLPNRTRVWREVRGGEKVYHFQGEAAVGKLFNGLVNIERIGVPNGI